MYEYQVGPDLSRWDVSINWSRLLNNHPSFVIMRGGYGGNVVDELWLKQAEYANQLNIPYGLYYVPYPKADLLTERGLLQLFERSTYAPRFYALDLEIYHYDLPARSLQLADYIMGETGKQVLIYTNVNTRNKFIGKSWPAGLFNYPLWVAHWTRAAKPLIPKGWDDWVLWQYSADGNKQGASWGVGARDVDLNRVNPVVGLFENWLNSEA